MRILPTRDPPARFPRQTIPGLRGLLLPANASKTRQNGFWAVFSRLWYPWVGHGGGKVPEARIRAMLAIA